jgi:PPOX class probable F420-dependent enzyme
LPSSKRLKKVSGHGLRVMPLRVMPLRIPGLFKKKLSSARVARLATIDGRSPCLVPVCFAFDGKHIYTAIDKKPKKSGVKELQRVRNIRVNPRVALILDEYDEDWSKLWYILVRGRADLIKDSERDRWRAIRLLRLKYPQYRTGLLADDAQVIRISPEKIVCWGKP